MGASQKQAAEAASESRGFRAEHLTETNASWPPPELGSLEQLRREPGEEVPRHGRQLWPGSEGDSSLDGGAQAADGARRGASGEKPTQSSRQHAPQEIGKGSEEERKTKGIAGRPARGEEKGDLLRYLKRPGGATLKKSCGDRMWQEHSVRGVHLGSLGKRWGSRSSHSQGGWGASLQDGI